MSKPRLLFVVLGLLAFLLSACSSALGSEPVARSAKSEVVESSGSAGTTAGQAPEKPSPSVLTDLHSLDELKTRFNDDTGVPRLVLLVSPT